ncbi:hypothetical protein AGLY_017541 [Aphis glycines]|uniref:Uncharacterized protein n=1 Tax=Aphis glycines TaxID=307491 RepID=A0A6G0SVD1_APHGL|nr:hypothetical protein AGLY_017541 [Aphis glycines]
MLSFRTKSTGHNRMVPVDKQDDLVRFPEHCPPHWPSRIQTHNIHTHKQTMRISYTSVWTSGGDGSLKKNILLLCWATGIDSCIKIFEFFSYPDQLQSAQKTTQSPAYIRRALELLRLPLCASGARVTQSPMQAHVKLDHEYNYSVGEGYRNMISSFGSNDLQTLLRAFGQNKEAENLN